MLSIYLEIYGLVNYILSLHKLLSTILHNMPKITFKTRTELAHEYGVDRKTFIRTLSREGILLPKGIVTSTWVKIIYETLGPPPPQKTE
jgi:predicted DNA-binding transcriptional regulator